MHLAAPPTHPKLKTAINQKFPKSPDMIDHLSDYGGWGWWDWPGNGTHAMQKRRICVLCIPVIETGFFWFSLFGDWSKTSIVWTESSWNIQRYKNEFLFEWRIYTIHSFCYVSTYFHSLRIKQQVLHLRQIVFVLLLLSSAITSITVISDYVMLVSVGLKIYKWKYLFQYRLFFCFCFYLRIYLC